MLYGFADRTGFLFRIPSCMNFYLRIVGIGRFGKQRFAEAAFIVRNQVGGGAEDMCRGAVVALKLDDDCAGKILFEAKNIVHFARASRISTDRRRRRNTSLLVLDFSLTPNSLRSSAPRGLRTP